MRDERSLCWQLFFPSDTRFEGVSLPSWLSDLLPPVPDSSRARVRVAWREGLPGAEALRGYEGLLVLGAPSSLAQIHRAGFAHTQRFLALPSIEDLRWLIPIEHDAAMIASQVLPRSFRARARWQRLALLALLKLGGDRLRSRLVTVVSRRRPAVLETFESLFPGRRVQLSMSTGTSGTMRKPTIACFDEADQVLAYAKVAISPQSEALVRNEAAVLRHIAGSPRLRGIAPQLLAEAHCDGRGVVVQSVLDGHHPSQALGENHRRFLAKLAEAQPSSACESSFVLDITQRIDAMAETAELSQAWQDARQALYGVLLPPALMHGDFAPWNLRELDGDLRAFDWEYGVVDGIAGLDELHHVWQTSLLLAKAEPGDALRALEANARSQPFGLDERQSSALADVYLLHGLLQRLEMGCQPNDRLVQCYRAAIRLRMASREVAV